MVSHGRDCLVRVKGNQPTVLAALAEGFDREEPGEPQAEKRVNRVAADLGRLRIGRLYPGGVGISRGGAGGDGGESDKWI